MNRMNDRGILSSQYGVTANRDLKDHLRQKLFEIDHVLLKSNQSINNVIDTKTSSFSKWLRVCASVLYCQNMIKKSCD